MPFTKGYVGASLLIASCILLSWSCESDSDLIRGNEVSPDTIELQNSITLIPVDSSGLVIYRSEPVIYEKNHQFFLYAYNRPSHSVDIYNLSARRFDHRIRLAQEGPDHVNKVYNMYVHSQDSIYIMGAGRLYLIDKQGVVKNSFNIIFEASKVTKGGYFHSPNEAYFKVDNKGENLSAFFIHNDTKASVRTPSSLKNRILGVYNLKKDSLSFLPVSYSDFIRENDGDFTEIKPNFSFVGDKLFYGFPIESNIYEFDFNSQKVVTYGAQSTYSENASKRYSENTDYNYRNEGTWFNRLNQYPGKPYYFRTHWGSQDKVQLNGEPTNALTKPGYIMFFDSEMRVIDEIELDGSCYLEGSFATDEGIFFWAKDGMDESEMKLCRYTVL